MTIYISGVHYDTDLDELKRIKNFITTQGYQIILPEEKENIENSWSEKLKFRLDCLESCFAIYMISTWKDSLIARVELTAAMSDKKQVCFSPEDIKQLITTLDN